MAVSVTREGYTISDDKALLDHAVIHDYLCNHSYWARGRSRAVVDAAIANSYCLGVYWGERQVGFARIVTDWATFAWLCDVFILPEFQGQGLGKWLMTVIKGIEALATVRLFVLATSDAHKLYEKYLDFEPLPDNGRWMRQKKELYSKEGECC